MTIVYKRSHGYGDIDTNAEAFQLGRKWFEAQRWLTDAMAGRVVDQAKGREIAHWFCELVAEVGQLRADYYSLKLCLHEPEKYVYVNDGPRKPMEET